MQPIRKTCHRWNEAGHAHALTFSCFHRQAFLSRDRSRGWMVRAIDRARKQHGFDLWAWVIMPEHVHLLIWPKTRDYSISAILKTLKQSVARTAIGYVRQYAPGFLPQMEDRQPNGQLAYRFWQRGGGYDRNLTEPSTIWAMMEYIHTNPVKRGLCQSAVDWKWSSAGEWDRPGTGFLTINRDSVPKTEAG